jgi:hypothetical protein
MLTPVEPRIARLEVDRHEMQPGRHAEAEVDQALPLPGLRARLVHLEDMQAPAQIRPPLREGVETGAQDDVLADAARRLGGDEILHDPRARHDARAEGAGEAGIHVAPLAPGILGRGQPQADLVVQHVRRRIDRHVQRPPEGDADGGVIGLRGHVQAG